MISQSVKTWERSGMTKFSCLAKKITEDMSNSIFLSNVYGLTPRFVEKIWSWRSHSTSVVPMWINYSGTGRWVGSSPDKVALNHLGHQAILQNLLRGNGLKTVLYGYQTMKDNYIYWKENEFDKEKMHIYLILKNSTPGIHNRPLTSM